MVTTKSMLKACQTYVRSSCIWNEVSQNSSRRVSPYSESAEKVFTSSFCLASLLPGDVTENGLSLVINSTLHNDIVELDDQTSHCRLTSHQPPWQSRFFLPSNVETFRSTTPPRHGEYSVLSNFHPTAIFSASHTRFKHRSVQATHDRRKCKYSLDGANICLDTV